MRSTNIIAAVALAAVIAMIASPAAGQVTSQGDRHLAASLLGVSEDLLTEVEVGRIHLRTLGETVTIVKAVIGGGGEVVGAACDAQGNPVDLAEMRALEVQARETVPGAKIHPTLAATLTGAAPGDEIDVVAWLHFDGAALDRIVHLAMAGVDLDDDRAAQDAEAVATQLLMERNAEVVSPVAALLRGAGVPVRYVSTTAPVLCLSATPGQVALIAELPEVDSVYLELEDADSNVDAHESHRTYRVHNYGVRGRGTRVAVLEDNGIDPACPHLVVQDWFNPGTPNPDDHIHGTAGCIASRLAGRIGGAPDVVLFSANSPSYTDTDVFSVGDWIITQNIDVTNMSYGGSYAGADTPKMRYFDYQSRHYQDSYVGTSGNTGLGSWVGSPGSAWNILTSGSFDNNDDGDWAGDVMSSFSATQDPLSGCEKPNLVAVGSTVDTLADGTVNTQTAACPGINQPAAWLMDNYCGTSFSAPFTTAALANAMTVDSTVKVYPEAAMALMMATAWHNIEGASRLSDQDGAGGLHALAAYRAAAAGHATGGTLTSSSFNNNGYYTYDIFLQGGDRTRVCLAWSANADSGYTTTSLDADLDLRVYPGQGTTSGTYLGTSSSIPNNFEIVEFTPPSSGWYTVRVNDYTFTGTSEIYGIAWSQKYADTACARLREYTSESSAKTGPTIGNQNYFMDWDAPNSPGSAFITYPAGTMTTGLGFSTYTWAPLDFDVWTTLWLDHFSSGIWFWNNNVGALNASGQYFSHTMALPNVPLIIGWPLHHVGITGDSDPASPDGFKEVTEVHTFNFWDDPVNLFESDDGSILQNLPFGFKFYGTTYTQCYVNMNGSVTFGAGSSIWTENVSDMLNGDPRVAGLWDDLGPHQPGTQSGTRVQTRQVYQGIQELVIEFINVPERTSSSSTTPGTGSNTFRIHLHQDDSITLEYRDCDVQDGLVGISPGNGISSAAEKDLTSSGLVSSGTNAALFEHFTGASDPFDLAHPTYWFNKLRFVPTSSAATNYRLYVDVE